MMGTSTISCHQPLRLVSCSLLVAAAIDGNNVASEIKPLKMELNSDVATLAKITNKKNHQYSERDALPLKSAYLVKHVLTDS